MAPVVIPEIEAEHALMRGPTPADVHAWAADLADPDVLRHLPKRAVTPRERAERSFNRFNRGWAATPPVGELGQVITLKVDGQLIGWCGARVGALCLREHLVVSLVMLL
jgi:RimJ/RimL family protein N-acetyltransferase